MRAFLDLVLPVRCVACDAPGALLCEACGLPLTVPARCAWPTPAPAALPPPYAVAAYGGAVRDAILAYKEEGLLGLQRPLGAALARAARAASSDARRLLLVPVPSSRAARRRRGDDVVRRLARRAAADLRRTGVSAGVVPALRHVRRVADSAGLGAMDRAANLAGAFAVRPSVQRSLAAGTVILVDDLLTTGATLAECAQALRAAGITVTAAASVAATQRHSESPR